MKPEIKTDERLTTQLGVNDISEWVDPTGMPRNWQRYTVDNIGQLLRKRTNITMEDVWKYWSIGNRSYHSSTHMMELVTAVNISIAVTKGWFNKDMEFGLDLHGLSEETLDDLILAIVFHDIIYIPGSKHNEFASAAVWRAACNSEDKRRSDVELAILRTDYVTYSHEDSQKHVLSNLLRTVDLIGCFYATPDEIRRNYRGVYEEVRYLVTPEEFRLKNLDFLSKYVYDGVDGGGEAFERYQKATESVDLDDVV